MLTVNDITVLDVETINNCNAGCALCLRHPGMRTNDTLEWNQVTAQIPQHVWQNLKIINFNGTTGDNIMHPDIFNIIEWTLGNTRHLSAYTPMAVYAVPAGGKHWANCCTVMNIVWYLESMG